MKILDRYILGKFLKTFVFVVLIIDAIVLVIDYTEKNAKYNKNNLGWAEIIGYYIDYMPWVTNLIVPLLTFIACVFITARLATHSEVIAILSSGISFRRLMRPYLMGSILIAGLSFWLTGWVIPNSNKERVAFEVTYLERPWFFNERNYHVKIGPEAHFYVESYSNRTQIGYKVALETIKDHRLVEKLTGARIEWLKDEEVWRIKNYQKRTFVGDEEIMEFGLQLDTTLSITPKDFENDYRHFETLTINELNNYMTLLEERGAEGVEDYFVELQVRYASPFAIIILTIIGLIVSSRKSRRGTGAMIAVGFGIAFLCILFFILSRSLATKGVMDITLAAWLPNIVFSLVAFIMYRTLPR